MINKLIHKLLFQFSPETAHHIALNLLRLKGKLYNAESLLIPHYKRGKFSVRNSIQLMGLTFPNHVGLAAGFDKNAIAIDGLASLGFGHIEVGTLTPKPQPGNSKPRLFRLSQHQAIINRMGFNNAGIMAGIENVKRARYKGILGINIGKNAVTPIENAVDDYIAGLRAAYPYASYITINISSPNTKNLRNLQTGDALKDLLQALKTEQACLAEQHTKYVPLVVKIAPDLTEEEVVAIAATLLAEKIDGVIATNTTQSRAEIAGVPLASEAGGLSGAPLRAASTQIIKWLKKYIENRIPIIAVGGIMSAQDAAEKLAAGASLVQIYTGFIYRGPQLIKELLSM